MRDFIELLFYPLTIALLSVSVISLNLQIRRLTNKLFDIEKQNKKILNQLNDK